MEILKRNYVEAILETLPPFCVVIEPAPSIRLPDGRIMAHFADAATVSDGVKTVSGQAGDAVSL